MSAYPRRNPVPSPGERWSWQLAGACRDTTTSFFHDEEHGGYRVLLDETAKAICRGCQVRAECAAHALARHEPFGIWGGFCESERYRLIAIGWEDAADHTRRRVDVDMLERRLARVAALR